MKISFTLCMWDILPWSFEIFMTWYIINEKLMEDNVEKNHASWMLKSLAYIWHMFYTQLDVCTRTQRNSMGVVVLLEVVHQSVPCGSLFFHFSIQVENFWKIMILNNINIWNSISVSWQSAREMELVIFGLIFS